jgi:hypothetical protein
MAYFKVDPASETGKKITEIFKRADEVRDRRIAFMKKVGAEQGRSNGRTLEGISGVVLEGEVDRNEWKYHDKSANSYAPKAKSKFKKEWDAIGRVDRHEIDVAVGNGAWFSSRCGFKETPNKEWYLFDITLEPKYQTGKVNPPEDCIEILSSEYKKLSGEE